MLYWEPMTTFLRVGQMPSRKTSILTITCCIRLQAIKIFNFKFKLRERLQQIKLQVETSYFIIILHNLRTNHVQLFLFLTVVVIRAALKRKSGGMFCHNIVVRI